MATSLPTGAALALAVGLTALATLSPAPPARAQAPSVSVSVDRRALTTDDDLSLEITLTGEFDDYTEPGLDGFEVLQRSQSQQIQIINGRMSRQQVLTMRLQPRRDGKLTIGAVTLRRGGAEVARSEPVEVVVRAPVELPPVPADRAQDLTRNARQPLFLQAETPRTTYYLGEPFVLAWSLYFQPQVQVTAAEITSRPALEGLLAEELLEADHRPRVRERRIGRQTFRYVMRSLQLVTGLTTGTVTIDPMSAKVVIGDVFRSKRRTVRSQPFTLEILPVPTEGRPAWYRDGNIGRFALTGSLLDGGGNEPESVQTGERLILEVTVAGKGSLVSVKPPVLEGAEDFEVQALPASGEDVITKDESGMHGRRVFQFILVPRKPGEITTPTVRFSYFDPAAGEFRDLSWKGRPLTVQGRAMASVADTKALSGDHVGPNIDGHTLHARPRTQLLGTPLLWGLLLAPLLGWLGLEARHRLRLRRDRDPVGRRSRGAHANAKKRLRLAEQAMRGGLVKDFYGHTSRTLTSYFEERANLPAMGFTHEELRAAAVEAGYPSELIDQVVVELENCDFARFAPSASADAQMRETLARVQELIRRLEAVRPTRKP